MFCRARLDDTQIPKFSNKQKLWKSWQTVNKYETCKITLLQASQKREMNNANEWQSRSSNNKYMAADTFSGNNNASASSNKQSIWTELHLYNQVMSENLVKQFFDYDHKY